MPKTSARKSTRSTAKSRPTVMGLPLETWIGAARKAKGAEGRSGKRAHLLAIGVGVPASQVKKLVAPFLKAKWQMQSFLDSKAESQFFQCAEGPLWILRPASSGTSSSAEGRACLEKSAFAKVRDLAGAVLTPLMTQQPEKLIVDVHGLSIEEEQALLVGLELASYSFSENRLHGPRSRKPLPTLLLKTTGLSEEHVTAAASLALSVNIARHYVNTPGCDLNPRTYAESIEALFSGVRGVEVDIWKGERLVKERMNLLLAVGGGASEAPRMVHLRYRPSSGGGQPVAIVGKGVTFDSGGLDIKPSSAMRWMKKDMGGSAAAVALFYWAARTQLPLSLDVYLSLAENAVGSRSFRPGDVIQSRNGLTVEIGNTDAEGRLVMADAMDVAVSMKGADKPRVLIDLATLTGAIKVALGADVAGLFTNSEELASVLFDAGLERGEPVWRMPLVQQYRSQIKSNFAEINNSGEGSFGGAITAALFLESFAKDVPWAHLDIYAWRDSAGGAWSESGANGQPVMAMALALTRLSEVAGAAELG